MTERLNWTELKAPPTSRSKENSWLSAFPFWVWGPPRISRVITDTFLFPRPHSHFSCQLCVWWRPTISVHHHWPLRCQPRSPLTEMTPSNSITLLTTTLSHPPVYFPCRSQKFLLKYGLYYSMNLLKFHLASHVLIMKSSFIPWCPGLCSMGPSPASSPYPGPHFLLPTHFTPTGHVDLAALTTP